MNNKPVAWMIDGEPYLYDEIDGEELGGIPLYTHPHPDNLGLALSIIDQQKLEIENLRKADLTQKSLCKAELTKKDVEERINFLKQYGASDRFLQVYEEAVRWTLFAILRKAQK